MRRREAPRCATLRRARRHRRSSTTVAALLVLSGCAVRAPRPVLLADQTPAPAPAPAPIVTAGGRQLDAEIERMERDGAAGAVLVARRGQIVLHRGYGDAHAGSGRPITTATVFDVARLAETMTAAAVLILWDRGLLELEAPASRYLTGIEAAPAAAMTIEQLLGHTAGLPGELGPAPTAAPRRGEALAHLLQLPSAPPGKRWQHAPCGYRVLAAVIEEVSGVDYCGFVRREIIDPIGLERTGFWGDPRWLLCGAAHGFDGRIDHGSPAAWEPPDWRWLGSGGLVSTVGDLHRWHDGLPSLLSRDALDRFFAPGVPTGRYLPGRLDGVRDARYGPGWWSWIDEAGRRILYQGGRSSRGHEALLLSRDDDLLVIVTASNGWRDESGATFAWAVAGEAMR